MHLCSVSGCLTALLLQSQRPCAWREACRGAISTHEKEKARVHACIWCVPSSGRLPTGCGVTWGTAIGGDAKGGWPFGPSSGAASGRTCRKRSIYASTPCCVFAHGKPAHTQSETQCRHAGPRNTSTIPGQVDTCRPAAPDCRHSPAAAVARPAVARRRTALPPHAETGQQLLPPPVAATSTAATTAWRQQVYTQLGFALCALASRYGLRTGCLARPRAREARECQPAGLSLQAGAAPLQT